MVEIFGSQLDASFPSPIYSKKTYIDTKGISSFALSNAKNLKTNLEEDKLDNVEM